MNMIQILNTSAVRGLQWKAMMREDFGYESFTTFYEDLTIAELTSGAKGVNDTFKNVCKSWLSNYKYFTEFVMCLNHKSWEHADTDPALSATYADLYYKAQDKFYAHYKNDEKAKSYYFEITD